MKPYGSETGRVNVYFLNVVLFGLFGIDQVFSQGRYYLLRPSSKADNSKAAFNIRRHQRLNLNQGSKE